MKNRANSITDNGIILRNHLRKVLKQRSMTYAKLAHSLGYSEITVKKWMSSRDMKYEVLVRICEILNLPITHLLKESLTAYGKGQFYDDRTEKLFSQYPLSFFIFIQMLYGFPVEDIMNNHKISISDFRKNSKLLEDLGLIVRLLKNRYRVVKRGPFKWIPHGKLDQKYFSRMRETLYEHFRKYSSACEPGENGCESIFRPYEMYLNAEQKQQFIQELSNTLSKFRSVSHENRGRLKNCRPISGILAVEEFDMFGSILLKPN